MTKPTRHILSLSGGKDSAALAIYMRAISRRPKTARSAFSGGTEWGSTLAGRLACCPRFGNSALERACVRRRRADQKSDGCATSLSRILHSPGLPLLWTALAHVRSSHAPYCFLARFKPISASIRQYRAA